MTTFDREVTRTSYRIEIDNDDFDAIIEFEFKVVDYLHEYLNNIVEKETYAINVDYNRHFGNYIYYTLDREDDNEQVHKKIIQLTKKQITKAKRRLKSYHERLARKTQG